MITKCPVCKRTATIPRNIVSSSDYLRNHLYEFHPSSLTKNGPFIIRRIDKQTYIIDLKNEIFHISVKNGGKNSLLSLVQNHSINSIIERGTKLIVLFCSSA